MRLAVDASILELPCPTGVERSTAAILRELPSALGPRDDLIVLSRGPLGDRVSSAAGVHTVVTGGSEPLALWRETRLVRALATMRADVLWSPVTAMPLRTRTPTVATVYELPWRVRAGVEGAVRERVHRVRLRLAVGAAARLVVPSVWTRGELVSEHAAARGRVDVVALGVDPKLREAADASPRVELRDRGVPPGGFFLHVGGTRPRKDVPFLLRSYARYRLRGGSWGLVLVGPGAPPTAPPPGAVHLGYVDDAVLEALYAAAGAVVIASISEGFGLPALEAMARGTPVVARAAGALPEVIGDAGLLVDPASTERLGEALRTIEGDDALRFRLVARGLERARIATFERSAAALVDALRRATETPCSTSR